MKKMRLIVAACLGGVLVITSCTKDRSRQPDLSYNPVLVPSDFPDPTNLSNPYFRFDPGSVYVYEGMTEDGMEHIEVYRTGEVKTIMGITCAVVRDRVWVDSVLVEDTHDWYAQDADGNVWYLGEDVDNYNTDGSLKDHAGAWEAGVDGAKPGMVMPATPVSGMRYRQEYYFGHAEDEAEILATDLLLSTIFGNFQEVVQTHEFTALEPEVDEQKFYAPGIGLVKEVNVADQEEIVLTGIR